MDQLEPVMPPTPRLPVRRGRPVSGGSSASACVSRGPDSLTRILELRPSRPGFNRARRRLDGCVFHAENFSISDVVLYADTPEGRIITGIKNRLKLDRVLETVARGFDAVLVEEAETGLLVQYVMRKRNLVIPPFMIGNIDRLKRARMLCAWLETVYGEDPFGWLVGNPAIRWFYSAKPDRDSLVRAGIPPSNIHYLPASAFVLTLLFPDHPVDLRRLRHGGPNTHARRPGPILAFGTYKRDYRTLLAAMRPIDRGLHIYTETNSGILPPVRNVVMHRPIPLPAFCRKLAAASAVVIPLEDTRESIGLASVGLSLALGKPLIVTSLPSMEGYVVDGHNGILVPPGHVAAMRRALSFLVRHPAEAKRMGHNSLAISMEMDAQSRASFRTMVGSTAPNLASQEAGRGRS